MKRLLLLTLGIGMMLQTQAQFFGGGFSGIVYDPTNYAVALKQLVEAKHQIDKLTEQIRWAQATKEQVTDIFSMQDQIRQELRQLQGLKDLRWNDFQQYFEKAMFLEVPPRSYFRHKLPYLDEFDKLLSQGENAVDSRSLYEFFYKENTVYDPAFNLKDHVDQAYEQQEKRYSTEMYMQNQQFHLAMSYQNLAEETALKAEELQQQVSAEGAMSMTEGERILAQKAAHDAMIESIDLREKANDLLLKAMQRNPVQKQMDRNQYYKLRLEAQSETYKRLIPGF